MPYVYIGRKNGFIGKTLWEILGNLKHFGVGRIVYRNVFQRYTEPCYYKIMKVAALPEEGPTIEKGISYPENRKVMVLVQKTFRGITAEKLVQIDATSYKTDYRLLPKDQEEEFCRVKNPPKVTLLPEYGEYPPLLKQLVIRNMKFAGETVNEDPKMKMAYNLSKTNMYRVAKEGEKSNINISKMGKILSPHLYE